MTIRSLITAMLLAAAAVPAAAVQPRPEIQTLPSQGPRTNVRHPRVLPEVSTPEDESLGINRAGNLRHWHRESFNFGFTYPSTPTRYDYYTYVMTLPVDSLLAEKVYRMMDSTLVAVADPSMKFLAIDRGYSNPREYVDREAERAFYNIGRDIRKMPKPLPAGATIPADNRAAQRLNTTDAVYNSIYWWSLPFLGGEYVTIALTRDLLFPAGALRSQDNLLLTFDKETGRQLRYGEIIAPKSDAAAKEVIAAAIAADLNRRMRSDRFTAKSVLDKFRGTTAEQGSANFGDMELPGEVALTTSGLVVNYPSTPFTGLGDTPRYNVVIGYKALEKYYEPLFKLYYERHLSKKRQK